MFGMWKEGQRDGRFLSVNFLWGMVKVNQLKWGTVGWPTRLFLSLATAKWQNFLILIILVCFSQFLHFIFHYSILCSIPCRESNRTRTVGFEKLALTFDQGWHREVGPALTRLQWVVCNLTKTGSNPEPAIFYTGIARWITIDKGYYGNICRGRHVFLSHLYRSCSIPGCK